MRRIGTFFDGLVRKCGPASRWPAVCGIAILSGCSVVLAAEKKPKLDPNHPLVTAEKSNPPVVKAEDLGFRTIVFEKFRVPTKYAKDGTEDVGETQNEAITRLIKTGAFARVDSDTTKPCTDPYLLVKGVLVDHKIVSSAGRFFGGALSGSSRLAYWVKVYDGAKGTMIDELDLSTENSAFGGAWTVGATDKDLPFYLGRFLADYLVLRARTDQGLTIFPLWDGSVVSDLETYTDPATQLTWAVKDNQETVTWDEAVQFAKEFRGGDFTDWRLPTEAELKTIYRREKSNVVRSETVHCADPIRLTSYYVWTSEGSGGKAKVFDFTKGKTFNEDRKEYTHMRALVVRKQS